MFFSFFVVIIPSICFRRKSHCFYWLHVTGLRELKYITISSTKKDKEKKERGVRYLFYLPLSINNAPIAIARIKIVIAMIIKLTASSKPPVTFAILERVAFSA